MRVRVLGRYNLGQQPEQYVPQRMLSEDWQKEHLGQTDNQKSALEKHPVASAWHDVNWRNLMIGIALASVGGAVFTFATKRVLKRFFPEEEK